MDKRSIKKVIKEAGAAQTEASQAAMRRVRRAGKIRQNARKRENYLKFRIGGNAVRLEDGEIDIAEFMRLVKSDCRELREIDSLMVSAGLRNRRAGKSEKVEPQSAGQLAPVGPSVSPEFNPLDVEIGFARVPPEDLRDVFKREFRFRYDSENRLWRGKVAPEHLVAALRRMNAADLVKLLRIDGVQRSLSGDGLR